jgi:hypothetical protein
MPVNVAPGVKMHDTNASLAGKCYSAANGSPIRNFGEKTLKGYTVDGQPFSMSVQCAEVKRTLGSVYRMNQGGNMVILDGKNSYMVNKKTGARTPIREENGQFAMYIWVKDPEVNSVAMPCSVPVKQTVPTCNRFEALAVNGQEEGFVRQEDPF